MRNEISAPHARLTSARSTARTRSTIHMNAALTGNYNNGKNFNTTQKHEDTYYSSKRQTTNVTDRDTQTRQRATDDKAAKERDDKPQQQSQQQQLLTIPKVVDASQVCIAPAKATSKATTTKTLL
jgi:hypothetical protein